MKKRSLAQKKRPNNAVRKTVDADASLVLLIALLAAFGLIMVASASLPIAEQHGQQYWYYLKKHLIFLSAGVVLMYIVSQIPMEWIEKISPSLILTIYVLLLLVFVPGLGVTVKGSSRWIGLGIANFQVVELVKVLLILFIAGYLVRQKENIQQHFIGTLKPLILVSFAGALLLLQPDFGSTVILIAITLIMLWIGGSRIQDLAILTSIAVPLVIAVMKMESYRVKRFTSFLNPWDDPQNSGFQLIQALIAIGRGEWSGVGLGGSVQKLFYLPEAHTDFILAVLAEELGLIGIVILIGIYMMLIRKIFKIGKSAQENQHGFSAYVAYGIGAWLGMQALISMGVNMGVLPTKGLTLPLMSYGGSSLLMTCLALGLVIRISKENAEVGAHE